MQHMTSGAGTGVSSAESRKQWDWFVLY